jgi:hypothetical protein
MDPVMRMPKTASVTRKRGIILMEMSAPVEGVRGPQVLLMHQFSIGDIALDGTTSRHPISKLLWRR